MVILQFSVVCLVMILWASILAFFPMLANFSILVRYYVGLRGSSGILGVCLNYRFFIFGLL